MAALFKVNRSGGFRMKIIGISGLHNSVPFKKTHFPNLDSKYYRIAQGFDSAAALIIDNEIIAAAAEERFSKNKATGCFPVNAIKYCLQQGGVSIDQVDYIAHGFNYEPYVGDYNKDSYKKELFTEVYSREGQLKLLQQYLAWPHKRHQDFIQVPHHLAHAASCYYLSGYKNALILIADGMGEKENMTVAVGENNNIEVLLQIPEIHSIGILYSVFTLYLGFEFGFDEYKVMGLAPYGNPSKYFHLIMAMIDLQDKGRFAIPVLYKNSTPGECETYSGTLGYLEKILGPVRQAGQEITAHHQDIAAAMQVVLQRVLMHVLQYYKQSTGMNNLVMAGGVALNCTANSYIKKSRLFANTFIQPAAGDDGTSLGAALYAYHKMNPNPKLFSKLKMPYYGPDFNVNDITSLIPEYKNYAFDFWSNNEELCMYVANQIADGQIVGWFHGRMEFGPRALGNRSILADPRDPLMKERLNARIKLREGFRPFAPAVIMEAAPKIFDMEPAKLDDYMYMLLTAQVRDEYKELLPAITHVDGSARVQVVFEDSNYKFWLLISKFGELTGIPVVINTSFNIKGQPIVCSVKDALETFDMASLDLLVIDNYLITRNKARK